MKRIQFKNTGELPGATIYVGRPTMFRNPFTARRRKYFSRAKKLDQTNDTQKFKQWLHGRLDDQYPSLIGRKEKILSNMEDLRGYDLACWCDEGKPCHADILLIMANA